METVTPTTLDPKAFRAALGTFATGVTVITTQGRNGEPIGLTANSFNSVSLDPPMVLWSLAKKAYSLQDFVAAKHWAVHVLSAEQEHISNQFARAGQDKFAGVHQETSEHGIPLLHNCAARFECTATFQYEGGDHIIFVGEVTQFQTNDLPPLVFHAGKYALATFKECEIDLSRNANNEPVTFRADMLGYMFGRARKNFLDSMRVHLEHHDLSDYEWRLLTIFLTKKNMTVEILRKFNSDALISAMLKTINNLQEKGWLMVVGLDLKGKEIYSLTEKGIYDSVSLLAIAKSHEEKLMEKMGYMDAILLKSLLAKFIKSTEGQSPNIWSEESVLQEK